MIDTASLIQSSAKFWAQSSGDTILNYKFWGHKTIAFGVHLGYAGHMAGMARIVAPGLPHHITQRGNRRETRNRRMKTFLREEDYGVYVDLMKAWCERHEVAIQAWCLMPNHVHLIAVPETIGNLGTDYGFLAARGLPGPSLARPGAGAQRQRDSRCGMNEPPKGNDADMQGRCPYGAARLPRDLSL